MKPHFHASVRFTDKSDYRNDYRWALGGIVDGKAHLAGSADGIVWGVYRASENVSKLQWRDHDGNWHDFEEAVSE